MATGVPDEIARIEAQLLAPGGFFETETVDVRGEQMLAFKTRPRTLRELLVKSVDFGDKVFVLATDGVHERVITFAEHARLVASVATALRDRYSVGKGDRVAILAANCPEWIITFWATISLGAVAVGLNGWSTGAEIRYFVGDCDPKVLVADRKRVERVAGIELGVPVVVIEDEFAPLERTRPTRRSPTSTSTKTTPRSSSTRRERRAGPRVRSTRIATSASYLMLAMSQRRAGDDAQSARPGFTAGRPDRANSCTSPLFHVSGLHSAAMMMLATGTKSVWLIGRFDPAVAMQVIERERCTGWSFTETLLHRMVNHPDVGKYDLSSVRTVGGGGSPVAPSLLERTREVFPERARSASASGTDKPSARHWPRSTTARS